MILPPGEMKSKVNMDSQDTIKKVEKGASFHDVTSITSVPPIENIHSAFQMSEYLNLLVQHDPHDVAKIVQVPDCHSQKASGPSGTNSSSMGKEQDLWIYEHLRRLPIDLTPLTTSLLRECTAESCPEMKAGEWQYICVANHLGKTEEEGRGVAQDSAEYQNQCCAIDYILHTLDSHTALWNSSQAFPSRISIKPGSERYFGTQARRISRIFSHAWYSHREIFEEAEAETSLYQRFVALVKRYELLNPNLLVIPSTAYDAPDDAGESGAQPANARTDTSESANTDNTRSTSSGTGNSSASKNNATTKNEKPNRLHRSTVGKGDEEDNEFRRDRFATPVTATRIDHGIKDVLGGADKTVGRGTLGRGRGKGIRKALFAVDVPAEEDEDEVDTHVEHVGVINEDKLDTEQASSLSQTPAQPSTNGTAAKSTKMNHHGDLNHNSIQQSALSREHLEDEEEQKDEPITTIDGIEFNV